MLTDGGGASAASDVSLALIAGAAGSAIGCATLWRAPPEQPDIAITATNAPPHNSHFRVFRIVCVMEITLRGNKRSSPFGGIGMIGRCYKPRRKSASILKLSDARGITLEWFAA